VTIVELVTLVALLIVLAALAIPTISPIVLRYRLRGAAWQVTGDLRLARQRAVTIKKRFRFCVAGCAVPVSPGSYSVEREDGAMGSGSWVNEHGVATRLPPDVTIAVNATPTFTLTGTAASGTVTLSNLLGAYEVAVAQSGRVQVCEGACP
jgi:type II secretory pathway pseudopilin PulG